jgi:protein-tyrosine-phosphatase
VQHLLEYIELFNMSRILRRPMFRKGGPTQGMTGIMSGIEDRNNYQDAGRVGELTKQNLDLLMQSDEGNKSFDPLTTFLLQYGPALASAKPTGSLIGTAVGAAAGPIQAMLAEQAERRKYLRGLKSGATQLAIEQVGKEDILAQEIAGRKDIELIKAGAKKEEMTPEFVTVFQENLSTYPGKTQVAKRATDFQVNQYDLLAAKVGTAKVGDVLTFNINDPVEAKQNQKAIKELNGKFVYDPFENNYKKIIVQNGKIMEPQVFNSIEEVTLEPVPKVETDGAPPPPKKIITPSEFSTMEEYQDYIKREQEKLLQPVPIEGLGQNISRSGRG